MSLYDVHEYMSDIIQTGEQNLPWENLSDTTILITGATGLVGSFLIDVLMQKMINCSIIAVSRDINTAKERFCYWNDSPNLHIISCDINKNTYLNLPKRIDYVLHLASNTNPVQYSTDPIGTIVTNVIGLHNMLEISLEHEVSRFLFTSSNEIYGENRGDIELFNEDYCGYINSNTLRAGYPESKRCGEALCQAYKAQYGLDIVIPRLTRSYGPTVRMGDTKVVNQFIRNGLSGEDIVLKSEGMQLYSFLYVADSVSGLLTVLLKGINGEAYNIADQMSDIMLKDLAKLIAGIFGSKVIYKLPDEVESVGFSRATKARLDGTKLKKLGWKTMYTLNDGLLRTIEILQKSYH